MGSVPPFQTVKRCETRLPLVDLFIYPGCGNLGMQDKAKQRNTRYSDFKKEFGISHFALALHPSSNSRYTLRSGENDFYNV